MAYKRILLKLSGEALMGDRQHGIDPKRLADYAQEIKNIVDQGIEVAKKVIEAPVSLKNPRSNGEDENQFGKNDIYDPSGVMKVVTNNLNVSEQSYADAFFRGKHVARPSL